MLEMPLRTGKRLQDASRNMREGFSRRIDARQQVNTLHRQRMSCSDTVQTYINAQNWTNHMEMSPSGRFRVVEEAKPRQRMFSKEGIRWDVAWGLLAFVVVLCAAILLVDAASMGIHSRTISRLDSKIADQTQRNEALKQELSLSAGDVSVCTEAVKLNLISGFGAQTISLTVPQEMSTGAVTTELRSASSGWMTGNTAD